MDPVTVIVISTVFCALIVSVFMVAYRYNSMTKEIRAVGALLRKQAKSQSAMNAKMLEGMDKKSAGNPKIAAAMASSNGANPDLKRITELLNEIIDRLDDMDVVLATHLTSMDREGTTTIPPMKKKDAGAPRKARRMPDVVPTGTEAIIPPVKKETSDPVEKPTPVEPKSSEPVPQNVAPPEPAPAIPDQVAKDEDDADNKLPPVFQHTVADRGADAGGWGAFDADSDAEEEEPNDNVPLSDKTAVRCPGCARQLPYDALKIQDEQTCPYCLETFRSNAYLLSLINEGQLRRKATVVESVDDAVFVEEEDAETDQEEPSVEEQTEPTSQG